MPILINNVSKIFITERLDRSVVSFYNVYLNCSIIIHFFHIICNKIDEFSSIKGFNLFSFCPFVEKL